MLHRIQFLQSVQADVESSSQPWRVEINSWARELLGISSSATVLHGLLIPLCVIE